MATSFFTLRAALTSLATGLHELCVHTMEQSLDDENIFPQGSEHGLSTPAASPITRILDNDLANGDIADIANDLVEKYGSRSIQHANNTLNAWRRNWGARKIRDLIKDDDCRAFNHPLGFWFLLKLLIVLHFFRNDDGSNNLQQSNMMRAYSVSTSDRLIVQERVIGWLSRIRRIGNSGSLPSPIYLSHVLST